MSSTTLAIHVGQNLFATGNEILREYGVATKITSYSHTIAAIGGYDTATMGLSVPLGELTEWIEHGIGRDVTIYSPSGRVVWNGFVDSVDVQNGPISKTVGPLFDVGNRVKVAYRTMDYNTTPPQPGEEAETAYANDTDSQAKYGIFETVYDAGERNPAEAEQIRDALIAVVAWPPKVDTINLGSGNSSLTVNCLGYYHTLEKYSWACAAPGDADADVRIQEILNDAPNSIISDNYTYMQSNTLQIPCPDPSSEIAWTRIRDIANQGDTSFNRWVFGVYAGRIVRYEQCPTYVHYRLVTMDPMQAIYSRNGIAVDPWDVLPGRWIMSMDDAGIKSSPQSYEEMSRDNRVMFIESVSYNAPHGLTLNGGKNSRLQQMLAQMGLGSI